MGRRVVSLACVACLLDGAEGSVMTHVWRPGSPDFEYPENKIEHLQSRENFGVAVAGGGLRGMGLAQGVTRSLRDAGLLDRAKYLSITSGSVWFGIPLYYQTQDSIDDFLGKSLPPSELTPEALVGEAAGKAVTRLSWPWYQKFPKSLAANHSHQEYRRLSESFGEMLAGVEDLAGLPEKVTQCLQNICTCALDSLIPEGSPHELWHLVTGLLLHPYGITKPHSTHCHPTKLNSTRAKLGKHQHIYVSQDVEHKLPFLLSQSSVFSTSSGTDPSNPLVAFPMENSPLYTGVPVGLSPDLLGPEKFQGFGDVLVEPFAGSSVAMGQVPVGAEGEMEVRRKTDAVNIGDLGTWQGTATAYIADWQIRPTVVEKTNKYPCLATVAKKFLPQAQLWSPLDVNDKGVPVTRNMPIGDAGVYDDLGHLPLLRRGVKKMVILDSAAIHDDMMDGKPNPEEMVYVKAAFGAKGFLTPPNPAGSPNPMMAEHFLTVFEPSEFDGFWQKMMERYDAGEPAVIRGNFTVVDNPHFGIKGGWTVEIVWVLCFPSKQWRKQLPAVTDEHLFDYLPNVVSSEPRSHFELSALTQYASWLFDHVVNKEIEAMLAGTPTTEFVV